MNITTLRSELEARIIGQPDAIDAIVPLLEMYEIGLSPLTRPIGTVMLLGPTGTGKTHTPEALAAVLHNSPNTLLRINCAEFQYGHEVAKLIGAPPGYLGHGESKPRLGADMLSAVRTPFSDVAIVVFDEIEKAHDSFFQILLGVLDKAELVLGTNRVVDFSRCLIFLTSNLGAGDARKGGYGFTKDAPVNQYRAAINAKYTPEFVNRIDSFVVYKPLSGVDVLRVLDLELNVIQDRLSKLPLQPRLKLSEATRKWLADKSTSPDYGVREMKRVLQRELMTPITQLLLAGGVRRYDTINVELSTNCLALGLASLAGAA